MRFVKLRIIFFNHYIMVNTIADNQRGAWGGGGGGGRGLWGVKGSNLKESFMSFLAK